MPPTIALQLYTIRDLCALDLRAALRSVRDLGFQGVELAGLHGHEPRQVREWLDESGLAAVSAHASADDLGLRLDAEIEKARTLGYRRLVMPWTTARSREETDALLTLLRQAAHHLAQAGLSLGYHNHDFELITRVGGGRMWDQILAEHSLFLEPDLGWLWFAGVDPRAFLETHLGRCPLVHVKDFRERSPPGFCPVGAGRVGYESLLPLLRGPEVEAIIVEQDESPNQDPMDACRESIEFVRRVLAGGVKEQTP